MEIIDGVLLNVTDDDIGKNGEFTVPEGVKEIGWSAFFRCNRLKSIIIPEGVTEIGFQAFYNCSSLTSVIIPDGVTEIGAWAFESCKSLTSVVIPTGVTKIGVGAFFGCKSLTNIVIPEGVESIGDEAFRYCESLTKVKLPKSITGIGFTAFFGCVQLKSKPANYKAFQIKAGELCCLKKKYKDGAKHSVRGELEMCKHGIHYCTNLFEVFNFYIGELDKDIAIYEIEVGDKVLTEEGSSKCCTNSCVLKKRLYREEIIKILNG